MQIPRRYDVFPSKVDTDSIQRLQPTFPLHDFITYVPYLHAEKSKMYYYHVGYGRMLSDNMQRTLSSALCPSTEWRKKFDWHHANNRLIIDWEANNPDRRCDSRLSFCSGNTFLVKMFFTFGKREVDPEEVHILQTTQVPLLFYLPKSQRRNIVDSHPERAFHSAHENFYDRYVLQPNSVYRIPGGTSYLLMTLDKSLFSLHRVTPELADQLESLWSVADPTSHTDYEGWRRPTEQQRDSLTDPYDKPPPSVMPLDYFVLPAKRPLDPCRLPVAKRHKAPRPPVSKGPTAVFKLPVKRDPPPVFKLPVLKEPVSTEPPPVLAEPSPVLAEPLPVLQEPLPESTEPLPVLAEPLPVSTEPLPVLAEPLPVSTEPLPVLAEPLPVSTEPLPVLAEPLPVSTEPLPVLQEPLDRLPVESPVQSPYFTKLPVPSPSAVTSYMDDFFNTMPDFSNNGQTMYYRPVEPPTFDASFQMESYPTFDTVLQMESYPMLDDSFQMEPYRNESTLPDLQSVFQPSLKSVHDASLQMNPTVQPVDAPPSNLLQPTESFPPCQPAVVVDPTLSFQPGQTLSNYDFIDFESMFSGLSESTLQELGGDLEHFLLQTPVQEMTGGI